MIQNLTEKPTEIEKMSLLIVEDLKNWSNLIIMNNKNVYGYQNLGHNHTQS